MSNKNNILFAILIVFLAGSGALTSEDNSLISVGGAVIIIMIASVSYMIYNKHRNDLPLSAKTFRSDLWFEVKYTDDEGDVIIAGETPGKVRIPGCQGRRFLIHELTEDNVEQYAAEIKRKRIKRIIITNAISASVLETIVKKCSNLIVLDFIAGDIEDFSLLSSLKKLEYLSIEKCHKMTALPELAGMKKLDHLEIIDSESLEDISALSERTGLQYLGLIKCPKINDISVLYNLTELKHFNMSRASEVKDITPLYGIDLLSLDLSFCNKLTDLEVVGSLRELRELRLNGWEHFDQNPALPALPYLYMIICNENSAVTDLSWLENQSELRHLSLLGCEKLTDVSGLDKVPNLIVLKFYAAKIKDENFAVIEQLESLEYLELEKCHQLTSTESFSGLQKLNYLEMDQCENLTDISSLSNLKCLNQLIIPGCKKLQDISVLAETPDLLGINMRGGEEITDLTAFEKRYNTRYLNLSGCKKITDLSPLAKLASLIFLDLSDCNLITEVSPLAGLLSLGQLEIMNWEKAPSGPLPEMPALLSLDMSGGKMKDLSILSNQRALLNLNAGNCDNLTDISALKSLVRLNALRLGSCKKLANIAPLEKMEMLTYLDLRESDNIFYILPLMKIPSLEIVYLGSEKKYHFSDIEKICQSLPFCKVFVQTDTPSDDPIEVNKT
jgi:Leucine Rich repeats (2 copies)